MSTPRRRPRDRKDQIARAAADAFSASGYHAVSMDDIATRVGISAAALYRHAAGKYELFRAAVLALSQQLAECTERAGAEGDPADRLRQLIDALIDTAMANRTSGGLYRWEGRYLEPGDRELLLDQLKLVNRRLQQPLAQLRPGLDGQERWTLSAGVLSVIGSIADHRIPLSANRIRSVLRQMAHSVVESELSSLGFEELETATGSVTGVLTESAPLGRYEGLLRESLKLFHQRGYRETSVDDIAASVGMPTSGVYRYFTGKSDILAASFRRAADRVHADVANILAAESDPHRALVMLADAYIARSFESPELGYLYYTDRANLPEAEGRQLRNIQRATVDSWSALVAQVRPELGSAEVRFVVHAAFALVIDLGRLVHYQNTATSRARVMGLMATTLFGLGNVPQRIPA